MEKINAFDACMAIFLMATIISVLYMLVWTITGYICPDIICIMLVITWIISGIGAIVAYT